MPLFHRNQPLELTIKGRTVTGSLLYEKERELAVRALPFGNGQSNGAASALEQIREAFQPGLIHVDYRQGNYECHFESKLLNIEADRSCEEGTIIVNLEVPGRVRRKLAPAAP